MSNMPPPTSREPQTAPEQPDGRVIEVAPKVTPEVLDAIRRLSQEALEFIEAVEAEVREAGKASAAPSPTAGSVKLGPVWPNGYVETAPPRVSPETLEMLEKLDVQQELEKLMKDGMAEKKQPD